ncbi:superoxide dismutase [Streptomyces sp. NBC_01808]|uniref:SMP-30/gluconolactonase/LRE family protein n=1 Tax=Streptomyces sp. NBC_01808 TaxID=2975947 RepID=UPI002DDB3EDF|nr:superoxide dismutase [Streptomyces sp. NBC_01808]WSA38292.1 superoxide dismutase [Streptomyces sp. NBC_01808]
MAPNHPRLSRRLLLGVAAGAAFTAATAAGTGAAYGASRPSGNTRPNGTTRPYGTSRPAGGDWPTEFPLPDGWLPEGITIGSRPYAYMGSRANGAILRADLRTGATEVIHAGAPGTASIGLKLDRDGLLYVAGGAGGTAGVIDARTGAVVATHPLTPPTGHFVNDTVLLGRSAWFTDSNEAVLYAVPRGRSGAVRALPLTGDWVQTPGVINANGIVDTPDGRGLIVVSSNPGRLYHVDPRTGHATEIALHGAADVANGDGLARVGHTLYVVRNRDNLVAAFRLDRAIRTATLHHTITDPRFDVPTTAARHGDRLYLVNARFTSPQEPDTTFNAVAVPL